MINPHTELDTHLDTECRIYASVSMDGSLYIANGIGGLSVSMHFTPAEVLELLKLLDAHKARQVQEAE